MHDAEQPPRHLRFSVFEVDLSTGELRRRGRRTSLQDQPFRVLAMLLERPGQMVTREELSARLWAGTVVDFDHGINKAVNKVREALGDSAENPRFVETIARRGYRFIAEVTVIDADEKPAFVPSVEIAVIDPALPGTILADAADERPRRLFSSHRAGVALALVSAVAMAAAAGWMFFARGDAATPIRSLAVLPLENLSGDASQEYFADGMTDELIADLGQIASLRVISRTSAMSYKHVHKPLAQIARELNVEAIVEGSVLHAGEHVRITTQLIRLPDERHLWAESYEGDLRDTLNLQNRVARTIAEQIRIKLNGQEQTALQRAKSVDPKAYEAYLKGRYFWNKRSADGLKSAIDFFNHAIDADPLYASAYSGLADSYALLGDWEYAVMAPDEALPKAKAAATKALALDDMLGEAHTSLAFTLDLYDWNWSAAQSEYQRAIRLNPGYATAHHWYAWHLLVVGRTDDGIAELRAAQSLDPLSLIIGADLASALCIAHRDDEAVEQSRRVIAMDPNFALAHYELGQALEQQHKHDEAIAELRKAIELSGPNATFESGLAYAYAASGRRDQALRILIGLTESPNLSPSANADIALVHVGLGDHAQAMRWLDKAYQAKFNPSILLRPAFDPLRPDARFQDLLHRIGLNPVQ